MASQVLGAPPNIDEKALTLARADRLRVQLQAADVTLCILSNPVSLRYALGFRNYALFQSHIPFYYAFVPAEGPVWLHGANSAATGCFDAEVPARGVCFFNGGPTLGQRTASFAEDVAQYLDETSAQGRRVAVEALNPSVTQALEARGLNVVDAEPLVESARAIKLADEFICIAWSIAVAEDGIQRMREALVPGMTENELWAILHQTNIANDGDWIDGRMLCSGPRTNPWMQEASGRVIEAGDLVAFDTDMIGPFGYCADISRTFLCGDVPATPRQCDLYQRAYDEVQHTLSMLRAGVSARELSDSGFKHPERFIPNRYPCLAHGVGMCDEFPKICYREDWQDSGYDAVLEEDMVICVESYVGETSGAEGVKLEQQVRITRDGYELLSNYPFEDVLLR